MRKSNDKNTPVHYGKRKWNSCSNPTRITSLLDGNGETHSDYEREVSYTGSIWHFYKEFTKTLSVHLNYDLITILKEKSIEYPIIRQMPSKFIKTISLHLSDHLLNAAPNH